MTAQWKTSLKIGKIDKHCEEDEKILTKKEF